MKMLKVVGQGLLVSFLVLGLMNGCWAQGSEQRFQLMIGFDPHPERVEFPHPMTIDGETTVCSVSLAETWNTKRQAPTLQKIGFTVRLQAGPREVGAEVVAPVEIAGKKAVKGAHLAEAKVGPVTVRITLDDFGPKAGAMEEVTLGFSLTGAAAAASSGETSSRPTADTAPETQTVPVHIPTPSPVETGPGLLTAPAAIESPAVVAPEPSPVESSPTAARESPEGSTGNIRVARLLLAQAVKLPADQEKARARLLARILSLVPTADASPEARQVHEEMSALRGSSTAPYALAAGGDLLPRPPSDPATPPASSGRPGAAVKPEAQALFDQATSFFRLDKEPEGREALRKALEADPNFHAAWRLLGSNALANRKYRRAKEAMAEAIRIRPDDLEAARLSFKAGYYLGEGAEAVTPLSALAQRQPKHRTVGLELAKAWFDLGDLEQSEAECLRVLQHHPDDPATLELLGKCRRGMR
jgi:tetratricopeptide (TPR) repeat protein